jgi:hypothetical protein
VTCAIAFQLTLEAEAFELVDHNLLLRVFFITSYVLLCSSDALPKR